MSNEIINIVKGSQFFPPRRGGGGGGFLLGENKGKVFSILTRKVWVKFHITNPEWIRLALGIKFRDLFGTYCKTTSMSACLCENS